MSGSRNQVRCGMRLGLNTVGGVVVLLLRCCDNCRCHNGVVMIRRHCILDFCCCCSGRYSGHDDYDDKVL